MIAWVLVFLLLGLLFIETGVLLMVVTEPTRQPPERLAHLTPCPTCPASVGEPCMPEWHDARV